jgi:membrane fusion protein, multidrug efflux system
MNTPAPKKPNGARRLGLTLLLLVVVLGGLGYGAYWFIEARHFETTDDAYVNGDVVQVSSQQAGTVLAVHVDDTQAVTVGTPLIELDPADAEVAMANAEAELARSVRPRPGQRSLQADHAS